MPRPDRQTTWPLLYSVLSKEEAHGTRTGITTRKSTQQRLRGLNRGGKDQKERLSNKKTDKTKETGFFLDRKNSEHETHIEAELNFFLFFFSSRFCFQ